MNPQENRDWERRLQELEMEINQTSSPPSVNNTEPGQPLQRNSDNSQQIDNVLKRVRYWFNGLTPVGKVAIVAIAVVVGFSLLRTVLQLVASLISLAIVGVLVYLVYKFLIAPKSPE